MKMLIESINAFLYNDFVFSPRYRILRHLVYWVCHTLIWAGFWVMIGSPGSYGHQVINMTVWLPLFILFGYPMAYWAVPHFLLKGKVLQFMAMMFAWGVAGLFLDTWYKDYLIIPFQEWLHPGNTLPKGPQAWCYLCITTAAAVPMIIKFFKYWNFNQREWMNTRQEKIIGELQLLKAQVQPHFLFNTLNNIYSFSLENSPKTPALILKLSELLSYMLYECKADEVPLQNELDTMYNYIELERERYGDKIEISWNVRGGMRNQLIAPLLMLPFIENAFKHGMSEQIEKSWLSVDISVNNNILKAKIANSKNECTNHLNGGIGVRNVRKRLGFIYPGKHELKLRDEGEFFVVSLTLDLAADTARHKPLSSIIMQSQNHEVTVPAY